MKKTFYFILILTFLLLLCSCSKKVNYRNDISCAELTEKLSETAPIDNGYLEHGEEQIKFFFDDTRLQDDFSILYSAKVEDINEIGVFHCPNEASAQRLYEIVENYLDETEKTQTNFIMSYAPMEIKKLDDAEVKLYGNYVIYAILDDEHQKDLWRTAENTLLK